MEYGVDKSSTGAPSHTDSVSQTIQNLEIPNKYDVVPIHNSDRGSFKRCRRYWDWSSPARHNLTVRADVNGIYVPFFFGDGIHYALEQYYTPTNSLRRDPVESFKTWFDIQWNGGVVTEDWLDKVYDLNPKSCSTIAADDSLWIVRGLDYILPDPNKDEFDELRELGIEMMKFYKQYAEVNDDFEVLVPEHTFSIPVWDFDNDRILTAIDIREESPNYGKILEVHARGRMDAVKVRNGKVGIIDHKTAESIGEDYFTKLETDEQCTSYLHAAEVEASYYDLSHKGTKIEEVLYNVLRKASPKPPKELASGMFSVDRQNESTTYPMLMDWISRNMPGVALNEKQQAYVDYVRESGDEQFVIRRSVTRNQHQLKNAGYRLYLEAMDMLDPNIRIYPNMSNDWKCLKCAFRAPCIATEDGGDAEQLIRDNYTVNKDR
jgi:PD-(D/E)XK nuclease superfamily